MRFMRQRLDTLDVGVYERGCLHGVDRNHEDRVGLVHDFWEVQPPLGLKDGTEHSQYKLWS